MSSLSSLICSSSSSSSIPRISNLALVLLVSIRAVGTVAAAPSPNNPRMRTVRVLRTVRVQDMVHQLVNMDKAIRGGETIGSMWPWLILYMRGEHLRGLLDITGLLSPPLCKQTFLCLPFILIVINNICLRLWCKYIVLSGP